MIWRALPTPTGDDPDYEVNQYGEVRNRHYPNPTGEIGGDAARRRAEEQQYRAMMARAQREADAEYAARTPAERWADDQDAIDARSPRSGS